MSSKYFTIIKNIQVTSNYNNNRTRIEIFFITFYSNEGENGNLKYKKEIKTYNLLEWHWLKRPRASSLTSLERNHHQWLLVKSEAETITTRKLRKWKQWASQEQRNAIITQRLKSLHLILYWLLAKAEVILISFLQFIAQMST